MDEVEDYIMRVESKNQREIMLFFHHLFCTYPSVIPKIKFKIPVYYQKTWVCYLNKIKNDGVELAFIRGNELVDAHHLLNSKNRKQVYGIDFYKLTDESIAKASEVFNMALDLDKNKKYKTQWLLKKKKK